MGIRERNTKFGLTIAIALAWCVHAHLTGPCTEWGGRDGRMERARRRPVALPGNGDDARRLVDERNKGRMKVPKFSSGYPVPLIPLTLHVDIVDETGRLPKPASVFC